MTFSFENLSVRIGNTRILESGSSILENGKVTALIGPNGAGKSTLLKAIAGLQKFTGSVSFEGKAISVAEQQARIAYMPQDIEASSSLTVLEVVLLGKLNSLGLTIPGELVTKAETALNNFGLAHLQSRSLSEISGGQRQLVYLTQALFREPELLLLDEPTAALDLRHQLVVLEAVRSFTIENNISVAVAIHDISLAAQFADKIICMSNGRIDISDNAEVVLSTERFQRLFGVEVEIEKSKSGYLRVAPVRAI